MALLYKNKFSSSIFKKPQPDLKKIIENFTETHINNFEWLGKEKLKEISNILINLTGCKDFIILLKIIYKEDFLNKDILIPKMENVMYSLLKREFITKEFYKKINDFKIVFPKMEMEINELIINVLKIINKI